MFYTSFARPRQGYEFLNSDYLQIIIFPVPRRREVIHVIHNLRSSFFCGDSWVASKYKFLRLIKPYPKFVKELELDVVIVVQSKSNHADYPEYF